MNSYFCSVLVLCLTCPLSISWAQDQRGVTDRLLEDLRGETDARAEPKPQSWQSVAQEMRRISAQIPQTLEAQDTLASQSAIIEELTRLLAKSKSESNTSSGSAQPNDESNSKVSPSATGDRNAAANKREDGSAATGKGPATKAGIAGKSAAGVSSSSGEKAEILVRRAWGQLPGRVRDRLQAGTPEKFHEKYQAETESYFKKLSEMEQRP